MTRIIEWFHGVRSVDTVMLPLACALRQVLHWFALAQSMAIVGLRGEESSRTLSICDPTCKAIWCIKSNACLIVRANCIMNTKNILLEIHTWQTTEPPEHRIKTWVPDWWKAKSWVGWSVQVADTCTSVASSGIIASHNTWPLWVRLLPQSFQ